MTALMTLPCYCRTLICIYNPTFTLTPTPQQGALFKLWKGLYKSAYTRGEKDGMPLIRTLVEPDFALGTGAFVFHVIEFQKALAVQATIDGPRDEAPLLSKVMMDHQHTHPHPRHTHTQPLPHTQLPAPTSYRTRTFIRTFTVNTLSSGGRRPRSVWTSYWAPSTPTPSTLAAQRLA